MANARILVNLYDGARQLLPANTEVLLRVRDGEQVQVFADFVKGPTIMVDVPFHDNFRDQYTVLASVTGCVDAGYFPVNVSPRLVRPVFLMLLARNGQFNFHDSSWQQLGRTNRRLLELFSQGATDVAEAQKRYEAAIENRSGSVACLLNIVTIMRDVRLPRGTVLDYLRGLLWDNRLQQDRFFAYADPELLNQIKLAATQKAFVQEPSPGLLHPGATCSYKQVQFGEANLQMTFHENDPSPQGTNWMTIEPDIDYFKDLAAHTLLEVVPGFLPAGITDPKRVYVLRWIAGHQANVTEFDPPYTIRAVQG